MKTTLKIGIALLSFLILGCEKHLDLSPESSITKGSFWKTPEDVEGAVNGMYAKLRNESNLNLFIWGEARSEMMEGSVAGTLGYDRYYNQYISQVSPGPQWSNMYALIDICNLVLKYAPNISYTQEDDRNNALGQAYTMRAYAYFTLVRLFGGVPLRTEPLESYDPATIQVPRTAKDKIFELIKSDIDKALQLFPNNNFSSGRAKWSKPALNTLKADVYLWTGKLEGGGDDDFLTALTALEAVQTADVALINYADVFKYANKGNKEVIMAINYALNESGEMEFAHNMYLANAGDLPSYVPQTQKDIVGTPKPGNGNVWRIRKLVRDQFTNDDVRKAATYIDVQSADGTQYYTNYGLKFNGTVDLGLRRFLNDWIIYRYADVLLMKAEAKNALEQDPSTEMEEIRRRAYGTNYSSHIFVNGSKTANDNAILKERLFEFALEGKRWWDLLRFQKAFTLVPALQGRQSESYLLLWPLSSEVRSREVLVDQTPGYTQ
ncbi:RagB/SusD family nutrient uptake outer membrane protein [Sphingobacterium sp. SGG-5]|uniref:RagB/SusD family nutrient uptake outer membrane protein n=1 Tax=Sphingobacterium sp. SGG-5 TaxID=2710881 RepID=UPI0013ED5FFA|nr:RagB/SusD family nutrient uptake outer membrane protein [Sphingobacterium sp. SGG-5]NGM63582.1 RagB/SusD family nutrient uptake outer membrane protein [Sphingobacterium sp. SGG-5]